MTDGGWSALRGAAFYEFRMQLRRRAVWIVPLVVSVVAFFDAFGPWPDPNYTTLPERVAAWAQAVQSLLPIGVGVLLADRLPRDRRTGVGELLEATPAAVGGRLLGKFAGATVATFVPILAIYAVGVGLVAADERDWRTIPLALLAFLSINLPGLLFVAAFSVVCPALIWVPLYQFLFVGYWFWGNVMPPDLGIPTLNGTLLTPIGDFMTAGFFGASGTWVLAAEPWQGALSILLLLGAAAAALAAGGWYLAWHQAGA